MEQAIERLLEDLRDSAKRVTRERDDAKAEVKDVRLLLSNVRTALCAGEYETAADAAKRVVKERDDARRLRDEAATQLRMAIVSEELAIAETKRAQAEQQANAQPHPAGETWLNALAEQVFGNALEHGWWNDPLTGDAYNRVERVPMCLALIHSEVSEALEAYRESDGTVSKLAGLGALCNPMTGESKPIGFASELADVIIRVLDLCAALNIDIDTAIKEKCAYNEMRPMRQGGKLC